jgi:hypothetical protein
MGYPTDNPLDGRGDADVLVALRMARAAIHEMHGPLAWEIYESASPEMLAIDRAIAKLEARLAPPRAPTMTTGGGEI